MRTWPAVLIQVGQMPVKFVVYQKRISKINIFICERARFSTWTGPPLSTKHFRFSSSILTNCQIEFRGDASIMSGRQSLHPGIPYKIQLSATPGTRVGLLAVDQSVYLLRNRDKLNNKKARITWNVSFIVHSASTNWNKNLHYSRSKKIAWQKLYETRVRSIFLPHSQVFSLYIRWL